MLLNRSELITVLGCAILVSIHLRCARLQKNFSLTPFIIVGRKLDYLM